MTPADPTDRAPRFRSSAVISLPRTARPSPAGFELLGELGRGGMGVVYKARQTALNRLVALKMVLGGHYAHDGDRLRFMAEAEAVAAVRHPNVVQVYEFGYSDGQPYFAMEYLDGGSLARLLAEGGRLPPAAAARLVERVARGVQAAHDVGLIHRDLKPGNILLTADRSQDSGVAATRSGALTPMPKVTDFGLAKRATGADLTLTGIVMGTPAYMAPEQATGQAKMVGPPADVYALGSILYECLTGRTPFTGTDSGAILARVANDDPATPRTFVKDIPADLELICLKCLAKLPGERYHSAAALADDLTRFLNDEPVSVRPAGQVEKAVKWVRRYPTRAIAYGLTLLTAAMIGLTAGALKLFREADAARRYAEGARVAAVGQKSDAEAARKAADAAQADAVAARDQLAVVSAARTVDLAHREAEANNVVQARKLLDDTPAPLRSWEWRVIDSSLRRERACLPTGATPVLGVAFTPDGRVTLAGPKGVSNWNADTAAVTAVNPDLTVSFAVSGDGSRLAAGGKNQTRIIDRATNAVVATLPGDTNAHALNRAGTKLLRTENGEAVLFDVATARGTRVSSPEVYAYHVAFGPTDDLFAVCGVANPVPAGAPPNVGGAPTGSSPGSTAPGVVKVFAPGRPWAVLPLYPDAAIRSVTFSPDGKRLAAGCEDGTVVVRDLNTSKARRFRGHTARANSLAFSPDGARLATGSFDRTVRVWDIEAGVCAHVWKGHTLAVHAVAFSPDGARVASVGHDGAVRVWDATAVPETVRLVGVRSPENPFAVTISDDGARVFVASGGAPVQAFDSRTGKKLWGDGGKRGEFLQSLWLTPDGKTVRAVTQDGQVREWDAASGEARPDGPKLAARGRVRYSADLTRAVESVNGQRNAVTVDAITGAKVATTAEHVGGNSWPAIRGDGKRLASLGVLDRAVRVWDADTGKEAFACEGHIGRPTAVVFSPDGSRVASVGDDGWVKLWDGATGKETLTLRCPTAKLVAVGFSPGGGKLVVTDADGVAHIRDAGPR